MQRFNLCELKLALEKECATKFIFANDKQHPNDELIHDFSLEFDSFEVSYQPNNFVLRNRFGYINFYCVKYIEYYDKHGENGRIFTIVCDDRPFEKGFSRYNILAKY